MDRRKLQWGVAGLLVCSLFVGAHLSAKGPLGTQRQNQSVVWQTDLKAAHKLAVSTNRPLLVVFGAPWCTFCKKLERETLGDPNMAAFVNSSFVPVHLDFEKDRNVADILEVKSLPASVILSTDADLLGTIVGYVKSPEYRESLRAALVLNRRIQQDQASASPQSK